MRNHTLKSLFSLKNTLEKINQLFRDEEIVKEE